MLIRDFNLITEDFCLFSVKKGFVLLGMVQFFINIASTYFQLIGN